MTLQTGESRREKSRLEHIEKVKQKRTIYLTKRFLLQKALPVKKSLLKVGSGLNSHC